MAASMISVVCRCGRNILRSQIKRKKFCDEHSWHSSLSSQLKCKPTKLENMSIFLCENFLRVISRRNNIYPDLQAHYAREDLDLQSFQFDSTYNRVYMGALHGSAVLRATEEITHKEEEYVDIEVSTEEFKFVEKLLPSIVVPEPPKHELYPTPSGWVPPAANISTPYAVNRTKNHNLPVYLEVKVGGTRKLTLIRKIDGDLWALEADLRNYLEPITGKKCLTQVHEVARFIRVRGNYVTEVGKFLIDKGF